MKPSIERSSDVPLNQLNSSPAGLSFALISTMLLITGLCVLSSCSRDPDDPDDDSGILVNLSDPDSVIYQIQVGIATGSFTSYMNAFTPDFTFHPDLVDSISLTSQIPNVFDNWDFSTEEQVMQRVLRAHTDRFVEFPPGTSIPHGPDLVTVEQFYELFLDDERYHGRADFEMRLDSGAWRIFQWKDFRIVDPDTTWGILKGLNR